MKYIIISILVLLLIQSTAQISSATTWTNPGTGDWFLSSNWDAGVPTSATLTTVNQGVAAFNAPANTARLRIGDASSVSVHGIVTGTSSLAATSDLFVGHVIGSSGIVKGTGELSITGSPLNGGAIFVGSSEGTGSNNELTADGTFSIAGADVGTSSLFIGLVGGTSSAKGIGIGHATVSNGNINIYPGSGAVLYVGFAGGTAQYRGSALGTLDMLDGNINASNVKVGCAETQSSAVVQADGTLTLTDGDLTTSQLQVGSESLTNGGSATGLLQVFGGTVTASSTFMGTKGKVVLGIDGLVKGVDYSTMSLDQASLIGTIEARFINGYVPPAGSVFDLITANNLTGNYTFNVTGIDPMASPYKIVRTSSLLRLQFVPEPSSLILSTLAGLAVTYLTLRRRTRLGHLNQLL